MVERKSQVSMSDSNRAKDNKAVHSSEDLQRLEAIFLNTHDSIITIDSNSTIVAINSVTLDIFGYEQEAELIGQPIEVLMNDVHASRHHRYIADEVSGARRGTLGKLRRIRARKRDGTIFPVDIHIADYEFEGQRFFVGCIRDMSQVQEHEDRVHKSLFYDQLTGLPNRETLDRSLASILDPSVRESSRFLMMEIGIDQMRAINTTFGMGDGNTVIRLVGQRLEQALVPCEFFGRGNGDRFTALFEIPASKTADTVALDTFRKMQRALSAPFEFGGARVSISVTAGGLEIPLLATDPSLAVRYADMAYYEAKNLHRGEVYLLTPDDVARVMQTSALVHQIREALQMQEFFPVFQPKIDLETGRCSAAECLIRWRTQEGNMISPALFIPVAESADLIEGIGRFIFLESCAAVQEWKADPVLSQVKLAVNISPKQLERDNFVEFVRRSLETFDIPASSLEFEITETTLANNPKITFAAVEELSRMGICIAIDDFGTGQSSLGMLREVCASRAKVDRAFLAGVPEDEKSNRMLRNIVNLMRDMNLAVTVEGIETREVAEYVRTLRCSEGQGFYFAKPMDKVDFEDFVRDTNAAASPGAIMRRQSVMN
ncbi:MAG: EAL domain-containing protein [Alphaproteobacteria bacterium]|nr:EAL domain-containing protein [Alphaproteobacteria bacterium]